MKLPLLAPRRAPASDRPVLCDAMIVTQGEIPVGQLPEWVLLTEKCTAPAEVVIEFSCPFHGSRQNLKCGPCSRDPRQFCGYCAGLGQQVPVQMTIIRRLT
jgi:hypothetical protein